MPKLQLQNVGSAPIVVQDPSGYTSFLAEVPVGQTVTADISWDALGYIAPQLKLLEGEDPSDSLVKLRWTVLTSATLDDRALEEGLSGLPSLNEVRLTSYDPATGASDVIGTGTNLLGNQAKASLQVFVGTARLDLEAVAPGGAGNAISCEIITPASSLNVSVSGSKVVVRPALGGSTVADIVTAINASATAKVLVQATQGVAGSFTAAVAEAKLTGGTGPGVSLTLGGTACVLTEVSATQLTFNVPTGIAASGRAIVFEYRCGPHATRVSLPAMATTALWIPASEKAAANGVATLDAGSKIPAAQIPAVALPTVHVVADATARLALTVQEGDEAIQLDDGSHWIYNGTTWYKRPSLLERTGAPELDRLDVAGGAAVAAAGGDIKLVGRSLLQGQTFDGIQRTEGAAFFYVYALTPGASGITCEIKVAAGGADPLSVTYDSGTKKLVINLKGTTGSTPDEIATAVNANGSQCDGYIRAVSGGGVAFVAAQAEEALIGGAGNYAANKVLVGGLVALPANEPGTNATAKWSDTGITCTTAAVGAATDVAAIAVQSNGSWTQPLSAVLV